MVSTKTEKGKLRVIDMIPCLDCTQVLPVRIVSSQAANVTKWAAMWYWHEV